MNRRIATVIALITVAIGYRIMSAEAIYPRTKPGQFEFKELPESVAMSSASEKPYFSTENRLFGVLFSYIRKHDVSMTVPVEAEISPGTMRFYVGTDDRDRSLQDTDAVSVSGLSRRWVAAYGVRGAYRESTFRQAETELRRRLREREDAVIVGEPYAVYWNSPFMPGFLKMSEVHIPVRIDNTEQAGRRKSTMKYNTLTPEEEWVILEKGTERPFTGRFVQHSATGTYICRRCNAPLFRSEDKFTSRCGWPSFDDDIPGAVKRQPDADGRRTEIVCAACGGHLGHVFKGEGHTDKNIRHCVNSLSMDFVPADEQRLQTALFASGCFWGTEYVFQRLPGVVSTTVGYTGGDKEKPTYKEVCSGSTGHAEALQVVYDPEKTDYETLCRYFFETHDPTQKNRQGPDVGTQYRSAVFYMNEEQKKVAHALIDTLEEKGLNVATEVTPAGRFWPAEDYHQNYYNRTGRTPYCHVYTERF